ncbi:hypothetical protein VaNZ11_015518 [Volvox africanus]|uniref:FHA domain-containing protein n=1 Tax=Volvox africanus TaxID=51714 RepID=A0ABQ5SLC7_9CHLO|nr:hypothetical protein VaNZ11_015518 [Volvox africanus]
MANYGVASYAAALGPFFDIHRQLEQQPRPGAMKDQQLQLQHGNLISRPGNLIGRGSPRLASDAVLHPEAAATASVRHSILASSTAAGRLTRSACTLRSRAGHGGNDNGGGVMGKMGAVAALRCHANDWLDVLLQAIDLMDGNSAVTGATAAAVAAAAAAHNVGPHPAVAATAAAAAGGGQAASPGPAVRVTAWVPVKVASSMDSVASEGSWGKSPAVAAALAPGEVDMRLRGRATVGDTFEDVANDDEDIGKQHLVMLRAPDGSSARRNVHLLNLLGLPQEVSSLRLPVSEPEPDRSVVGCNEDHGWSLEILDGAVGEARDPAWALPYGFTYDYDFPPSATMPQALPTAEGSYSLVDSCLGLNTSQSVLALEAVRHHGASQAPPTPQQQQLELQQQQQHRSTPVAVEVLNLLAEPTGAGAAALQEKQQRCRAVPYIGDCLVSYIDCLEWNDGELGGSLQSPGADSASYPGGDMFAFMFSEDELGADVSEVDLEVRCAQVGVMSHTTDGVVATGGAAAAAHGGDCPCNGCRRRRCSPEGGGQWPCRRKEPLLTSLTTGAVQL